MWAIIILVLVVAMMVGPIMMMQPTKAQKRLVTLRQMATTLGLRINSSTLKEADGGACWFYWLSLPETSTLEPLFFTRKPYAHGLHVAEFWAVTEGVLKPQYQTLFEQELKQLPDSVLAIEINAKALGVHWTEFGGESALKIIAHTLKKLCVGLGGPA